MTSSPILVTRPEPACGETVARLAALGYDTIAAPALIATALPPRALDLNGATLIVTSPQSARFLKDWSQLHRQPVLAVGARTAALLQASGFTNVAVGGGTADRLPALVKTEAAILLGAPSTGHALVRQLRATGIHTRRVSTYRVTDATRLSGDINSLLEKQSVCVLFYSARTARSFLYLAAAYDLARHTAVCLSETIAVVARLGGFGQVQVAAAPTEDALQDALQRLLPALV